MQRLLNFLVCSNSTIEHGDGSRLLKKSSFYRKHSFITNPYNVITSKKPCNCNDMDCYACVSP